MLCIPVMGWMVAMWRQKGELTRIRGDIVALYKVFTGNKVF